MKICLTKKTFLTWWKTRTVIFTLEKLLELNWIQNFMTVLMVSSRIPNPSLVMMT